MNRKQALDFINTLDSKHQSLQPTLRTLVRGETVTTAEVAELAESDSRLSAFIVPILNDIASGTADDDTIEVINGLDSFGAPLQPLLLAMVQGLTE